MIVNTEKIKVSFVEAASMLMVVLYMIGIRLWFPVCKVSGDTIMSCHWAGQMLKAVSIMCLVLMLAHIFMGDRKMKVGVDVAFVCIYILTLNIPGRIINLCMKAGMMCRKNTMTWTMVFCIILIILSIVDAFYYLSQESNEKHKRVK